MTNHPEYRPLRPRHHEALIGQELRRLVAEGWLHEAPSVSRSTADSHAAGGASSPERLSVTHGFDGVLTGP